MAGGFATAAIRAAADTIVANVPSAVLSGIVAPAGSTPGYHWPRNTLPAGHYTVQHPRDQAGNPGASSGLDISLNSTQMSAVTSRFNTAIRAHDPRLSGLAELVGTTDGRNIWSWHINSGFQTNVYDDSHRWHVHVGGLRDSVEDFAVWAGIAAVFVGSATTKPPAAQAPQPEPEDDDMKPYFIRAQNTEQLYMIVADKVIKQSEDEGRIAAGIYGVPFTITARAADTAIQNLGQQLERKNGQR